MKKIKIKLFEGFLKETFMVGIMDFFPMQVIGDAGIDVRSMVSCTIEPGEHKKIPLGFGLELPDNMYARVEGRSGNAFKFGIDTIGNIIDPSYRGEIHAILVNNGNEDFVITRGDRIAQIIISKFENVKFIVADELEESKRGEKGFGSSGSK